MTEQLFADFIMENKVDETLCSRYEGILPKELLNVWRKYGFGSFIGGYLKIINPMDYQELLLETYFRGEISIPIFITAFGDVITWEENRYIRMIKYKNGLFKGMASGFDFFLDDLQNGVFNRNFFEISKYNEAVDMLGNIKYDECFGYVPLLGLGGSEKVENLKKVKTREHIELISQLVGKIGM